MFGNKILKKTNANKVVRFGVLRGTHLVYRWAEKNKIDFYYIDRPYWGETRNSPYYVKIVKNNHLKNWQEKRPDDRFKKSFFNVCNYIVITIYKDNISNKLRLI